MPRPKTSFKNYEDASAYVKQLNLRSIKDWNEFSQNKNSNHSRPKDIPSNPWRVYGEELAKQGKKFSIRAFIGSGEETETPVVASKRQDVVMKKPVRAQTKPITYAKARSLVRKMRVKSRADFNALVRMKLLPKEVSRTPASEYPGQWQGWKSFLGAA
jgi:hypothetical protein